jgi:hypothetical protein
MSEVSKEQIEEWKAKHESVFCIEIEDKKAYLKSPDRKTLSFASTVATSNPLKFNEILLKGCWLGGDEEIQTNDSLFLSASSKLAELIEVKEATLVKL